MEGPLDFLIMAGGDGRADTMAMRRCRVAWIELSLFPKAVLRSEKRGVRPGQALAKAKNRLDRWMAGERESFMGRGGERRRGPEGEDR